MSIDSATTDHNGVVATTTASGVATACVYCHGISPSSDGRTECGWCDDGVLRHREWWMPSTP